MVAIQARESGDYRMRIRFAPFESQRMYLVTGAELPETEDGGETWASIGRDLAGYPWFYDVAVDPFDPGVLYAFTPAGMYRSVRSEVRTAVHEERVEPSVPHLQQSFPNPFNSQTAICYQLDRTTPARLTIYNIAGQQVRTLVDEVKVAGGHRVSWDGRDDAGRTVGSGVYFYQLSTGLQVQTRRLVVLK